MLVEWLIYDWEYGKTRRRGSKADKTFDLWIHVMSLPDGIPWITRIYIQPMLWDEAFKCPRRKVWNTENRWTKNRILMQKWQNIQELCHRYLSKLFWFASPISFNLSLTLFKNVDDTCITLPHFSGFLGSNEGRLHPDRGRGDLHLRPQDLHHPPGTLAQLDTTNQVSLFCLLFRTNRETGSVQLFQVCDARGRGKVRVPGQHGAQAEPLRPAEC